MKAISVWEPWATLMAIGAKRIETRSWGTAYRGWLAIHASKAGLNRRDLAETMHHLQFRAALQGHELKPGHILAIVKLIDCCPTSGTVASSTPFIFRKYRELDSEQERAFGNYEPCRYGWVTGQLFRLPEPIPYRAKQGLFELESDVVADIRRQFTQAQAFPESADHREAAC